MMRRAKRRYTLSHLVHDMKDQTGVTEPMRDWFPLSAMGPFSNLDRLLIGRAKFGAVNCGCHPNCGVGTILFVNKRTKQMVPLLEFLRRRAVAKDINVITDGNMPKLPWRWRDRPGADSQLPSRTGTRRLRSADAV